MSLVEQFRRRFGHLLTILLWLQFALIAACAQAFDLPGWNLSLASLALAALPTMLWRLRGPDWLTRQLSSLALVGQVMLLVYVTAGHPYQPDIHMSFFAALAIAAGWLDWRIFVSTTVAIAAHHAGLNLVYPEGVFPGGSDGRRVLLHAAIVVVQNSALGWIVITLRSAFITAEAESERANAARLVAEQAERDLASTTLQAALERQALVLEIADDLEVEVAGIAGEVFASVEPLRMAASQMSEGARRVQEGAHAAAASSDHASSAVAAATIATSGLASAIGEIREQVGATRRVVEFTTSSAHNVLSTVHHLSLKAEDIGQIVQLISTIAERTNLLALNASIEAARFGVQGQGFAVVAQEVKALASQTSQATADIQKRIAAIHESGSEAVRAIEVMGGSINSLNDVSASVAAAIVQQDQATAGIAENIGSTAQDAEIASDTIRRVIGIANEAGSAAGCVSDAAEKLAAQAAQLDSQVRTFLQRIRQAA
jgi:methyl-accepting chemotaxis protein